MVLDFRDALKSAGLITEDLALCMKNTSEFSDDKSLLSHSHKD